MRSTSPSRARPVSAVVTDGRRAPTSVASVRCGSPTGTRTPSGPTRPQRSASAQSRTIIRSSTRGSCAIARWKARLRTRRTWRAWSAVASEGQRPGGDGDARVEDRHARRGVDVPAGREGQRLEGDVVVPRAHDVAGAQQLGRGAPGEEQVARDHAVDEQEAHDGVDVAELLVRVPRAGLEHVRGHRQDARGRRVLLGVEAVAELGLDVEEGDGGALRGHALRAPLKGAPHSVSLARRALNHRSSASSPSTSCAPSRAIRERGTTRSKPAASARSRTSGSTWAKKPSVAHFV